MEVWKSKVAYPNLREMARNIVVLFGNTYMCEAAFSRMKYLKKHIAFTLNGLELGTAATESDQME